MYSAVKQRLKWNTGKVCNCLIRFLLTMVLLIEERVFLVEYVFGEGTRCTNLVQEHFAEKFPETPVPLRNAVDKLIEKFRETLSVLDAERSGRPSKINYKKLMDIYDSMLRFSPGWDSISGPSIPYRVANVLLGSIKSQCALCLRQCEVRMVVSKRDDSVSALDKGSFRRKGWKWHSSRY
jgi:hypothetical protein